MWVPTTLLMTTFECPTSVFNLPRCRCTNPPCSFGQDEGSRGQDRYVQLCVEDLIRLLNQPHTVERLVKMGDQLLEHLGLKSAELNPMTPLDSRNDDLAVGLAHRRTGGCPSAKRTSCVGWGPRLSATKHSEVLGRSSAVALQSMRLAREGLSNVFYLQARWQPGPHRQNGAREAHHNKLPVAKPFCSA